MEEFLIDANVFLELELSQSRAPECKAFLTAVSKRAVEGFVTDYAIDSVALVMESKGSPASDIKKFLQSLTQFKGLSVHELSIGSRIEATREMEEENLDYDDATAISAMKSAGLTKIVSFDKDFDGIDGIKRIDPNEATPEETTKKE